jgi:hypothetical protein
VGWIDPEQIDLQYVPVAETHEARDEGPIVRTHSETHMLDVVDSRSPLVEYTQTFQNFLSKGLPTFDGDLMRPLAHDANEPTPEKTVAFEAQNLTSVARPAHDAEGVMSRCTSVIAVRTAAVGTGS